MSSVRDFRIARLRPPQRTPTPPPPRLRPRARLLLHLVAGVGDFMFATSLLQCLIRGGYRVELFVDGDYGDIADLFEGWDGLGRIYRTREDLPRLAEFDVVIPAIQPDHWPHFIRQYRGVANRATRPVDALFLRDQRAYYLAYAELLGVSIADLPDSFLPIAPDPDYDVGPGTLVLAPGSKYADKAKRWPYYPELAERFADVVLVGIEEDLVRPDGTPMAFPDHVRSFVGRLTLHQTARLLAGAGTVVANDTGLGHVAAAVGSETLLLFGPTSEIAVGRLPPNAWVVRHTLPCTPCWFRARLSACGGRVPCMSELTVDRVADALGERVPTLVRRAPERPEP